ncbi:MAG: PIG-L deacetylase family protein [Actinomycetota bacterium]|nr:PIG-L deacetylase family protein [Actinomycetota bacterium]
MDPNSRSLPPWKSVLAVVAHPDDESFGLGAVLSSFVNAGGSTSVLCFTHGEASTLHGVEGELAQVREAELRSAGIELGLTNVRLLSYADGDLASANQARLRADILTAVRDFAVDGLLVFDPSGVTSHPDHQAATQAALQAAQEQGLGVLAWTLPADVAATLAEEFKVPFKGHQVQEVDVVIDVDRGTQLKAVQCHPSQAVPGSALWRRLALLGDREHLRWLA